MRIAFLQTSLVRPPPTLLLGDEFILYLDMNYLVFTTDMVLNVHRRNRFEGLRFPADESTDHVALKGSVVQDGAFSGELK